MRGKIPIRMRVLTALTPSPDWDSITPDQVVALRARQERLRRSAFGRFVTGAPDRAAVIGTESIDLPDRRIGLRVHRPARGGRGLPLVIAFHGGGFITGVPDQDDWLLSHLAAHCPAVVVSVDYRLAPRHPLPAQVDDACAVAPRLVESAARWGADPARLAVLGASAGATLAALLAIRAEPLGLPVRTQVLINPQLDWTDHVFDYPSFTDNADSPTATPANCRAVHRLTIPAGFDAGTVSPLRFAELPTTAPALIQSVGTDPLEDQATAYADRLRQVGTAVTVTGYPEAAHGFLSMPGVIPAAATARAEILAHLRGVLSEHTGAPR